MLSTKIERLYQRTLIIGQIINRMIATLVNISKKFVLYNHIVHKYRYKTDIKIDIVKSMNIYNISI